MSEETQIQETHHDNHHAHSDEVVLPFINRRITVYGGIYTVVLFALAGLTLIEAGLTFLPENAFIVLILVTLSLIKAYLVCMFYMHLNTDNPLFRLALIAPLIIVLISIGYLIFVPATPGLGYY